VSKHRSQRPVDLPLFVYGSLMRGQQADGYLADRRVVAATVRGRLYRVPAGYPALVIDPKGHPIHGELVLDPTPGLLRVLDVYEGVGQGLYRRETAQVTRDVPPKDNVLAQQALFSSTSRAWVYVVSARQAKARRYHPLEVRDWRKVSRR